jgi:hypothetical protein
MELGSISAGSFALTVSPMSWVSNKSERDNGVVFARVIKHAIGLESIPTDERPARAASMRVVPLPQNGSSTRCRSFVCSAMTSRGTGGARGSREHRPRRTPATSSPRGVRSGGGSLVQAQPDLLVLSVSPCPLVGSTSDFGSPRCQPQAYTRVILGGDWLLGSVPARAAQPIIGRGGSDSSTYE